MVKYGPTGLYGPCEHDLCNARARTVCVDCAGEFCLGHDDHPAHSPAPDSAHVAVLALPAVLDFAARVSAVESAERVLRETPDIRFLSLDLAGVQFMDSSGIAALVAIRRAGVERGVQTGLSGASADVANLLRRTGVDQFMTSD